MKTRAKKSLGQNFLVDKNYQQKIISAVNSVSDGKNILEIGPGQGALSQYLFKLGKSYQAVEKDKDLIVPLRAIYGESAIFEADFMDFDLSILSSSNPIIAVGNLPYNVASQIFIKLLENRQFFSDLFLMFQKEMALRFVAKPGTKDYGLLTLWATIYTEAKILFHLPPTVFRPQPKIVSSFVHFKIKTPLISAAEAEIFWPFVRQLFQHRRKTIAAVLKDKKDKLPPELIKVRAEDLSVKDLIGLFRQLYS